MSIYSTNYYNRPDLPHRPYLYVIGWTEHDVWYQGIQYGKMAHPDNIWKYYFTSSRYVKAFASQYGDPDVIETLPLSSKEEAISEEIRYQTECDVIHDPRWLNCAINGDRIRTKNDLTHLRRIADRDRSTDRKRQPWTDEMKARHRETMTGKGKGKKRSPETRARMAEANRKRWEDNAYREKMSKIARDARYRSLALATKDDNLS